MSRSTQDKSFWLATYGPYTPNPRLHGVLTVDVAIIGGGFTGLSTAYNLRQAEPALQVAVLEAEEVGYGASGRNGGFSMTLFGLEPSVTKALFGHRRTVEAHRYMERAVDYVDALIREHDIQSDYSFPGFLRAATAPGYVRRVQHDMEILTTMGVEGIEWLDAPELRARVNSPRFLGGWWEPRCGLLNPAKQARELKRIAEAAGVKVFETTPVVEIQPEDPFILHTPEGIVKADRMVFATNAYSHLFPQLRRKQVPVFTHMIITEPLTKAQMEGFCWQDRQGVEDARNLVHYLRLTADDRLAIGGGDVTLAYGKGMDHDLNDRIFAHLESEVAWLFPGLEGVRFTHRWGGPVSVPIDMAPVLGTIGGPRAVYSLGCVGHGVSMAHLNGCTLADLILERTTDLTEVWFVNRRSLPWPPEPLRLALSHVIRGYLRLEDAIYERNR